MATPLSRKKKKKPDPPWPPCGHCLSELPLRRRFLYERWLRKPHRGRLNSGLLACSLVVGLLGSPATWLDCGSSSGSPGGGRVGLDRTQPSSLSDVLTRCRSWWMRSSCRVVSSSSLDESHDDDDEEDDDDDDDEVLTLLHWLESDDEQPSASRSTKVSKKAIMRGSSSTDLWL